MGVLSRVTKNFSSATLLEGPLATQNYALDDDAKSEGGQTTYTDSSFDDFLSGVPSDLMAAALNPNREVREKEVKQIRLSQPQGPMEVDNEDFFGPQQQPVAGGEWFDDVKYPPRILTSNSGAFVVAAGSGSSESFTTPRKRPLKAVTSPSDPEEQTPRKKFKGNSLTSPSQPAPLDNPELQHKKVVVIADHPALHDPQIGWGIKWEYARLFPYHKWEKIDEVVPHLRGPHTQVGPELTNIIRNTCPKASTSINQGGFTVYLDRELAVRAPWRELDREDKAWAEGSDEGIGLKSEDKWYGGKVQFLASLDVSGDVSGFKISLEAPVVGKSTSFARALHSKSAIPVRIKTMALDRNRRDKLRLFLKSCFKIFGRNYYMLEVHTDKVLLVDAAARRPGHSPSNETEAEADWILWLINYLNPLEFNTQQALIKWRARFQLNFSDTIPGYRIPLRRILEEKDIELPHPPGQKCPSEKIMTDGCGRLSRTVLKGIQKTLGLDRTLTAVQLRFYGSKGMGLTLLPGEKELQDIILRPSQIKTRLDPRYVDDEAKLTIDVVRPANLSTPARLSAEAIQIMSWNGVPHDAFVDLQEASFEREFGALVNWPEDGPLVELMQALTRLGNVINSRRARLAGGTARARGLSSRSWEEGEDEADDLDDPDFGDRSAPWWPDYRSGCPSSLAETCLVNLQAGFRPESLPYLREKLRNFLSDLLTRHVDKFKITVEHAVSAIFVPDPTGLLQPNQISVSLSDPITLEDGRKTLFLEGPALVLRNPAKQETDVRKVEIVYSPSLAHLRDVIVFSVQDRDRSLASRLGGGDYDGDRGQVIFDNSLVDSFRNAPTDIALTPPKSVENAFQSMNGTVAGFLDNFKQDRGPAFINKLQDVLLTPLGVSPGEYSIYHETVARAKGIGHPEAIRLGYMFTESLDGAKTGKTVKPEVLDKDRKKYQRYGRPKWNRDAKHYDSLRNDTNNRQDPPEMPRELRGVFVMDRLRESGEEHKKSYLKKFDDRIKQDQRWESGKEALVRSAKGLQDRLRKLKPEDAALKKRLEPLVEEVQWVKRDADPAGPWCRALEKAVALLAGGCPTLAEDLLTMHDKIYEVGTQHSKVTKAGFTGRAITSRQDALRDVSRQFEKAVSEEDLKTTILWEGELEMLKASCAYVMKGVKGNFAFDVATRTLGCAKARASGPFQAVSQPVIEGMQLHKGYVGDFQVCSDLDFL